MRLRNIEGSILLEIEASSPWKSVSDLALTKWVRIHFSKPTIWSMKFTFMKHRDPLLYRNVFFQVSVKVSLPILDDRLYMVQKKIFIPAQLSGGQQQLVGLLELWQEDEGVIAPTRPTGNLLPVSKEIIGVVSRNSSRRNHHYSGTHARENRQTLARLIICRWTMESDEANLMGFKISLWNRAYFSISEKKIVASGLPEDRFSRSGGISFYRPNVKR